jgi:hypothetical protein
MEMTVTVVSGLVFFSTLILVFRVYFKGTVHGPMVPFAAVPGVLGPVYLVIAVLGFNRVNTERDAQVGVLVKLRLQLQMDSPLPNQEKTELQILLQCMIDHIRVKDEAAHLRIFGFPVDRGALYALGPIVFNAVSLGHSFILESV